jgi:exonuclease SbcD
MRFLHTSDWHLGRTLHNVDLIGAQRSVLQQLVAMVAAPADGIAVDAVIVAGDIYDRAVPPVEAVALFSDTLADLAALTTVIVTSGNHDSAIRLGFGSRLFTDRLHLRTDLASIGTPVIVGDVAVYPLPYLDPDVARVALAPTEEPLARSHQAVMGAAMDRVRADLAARGDAVRSVVVAHAFVVGGAPSDSERSIVVGGVDHIAAPTFDGVDYVALGHLHGAQQPRSKSSTVLRYSGSPLRYSFSERGQQKSVTVVDLLPAGVATASCGDVAAAASPVSVTVVPLAQPRPMADLRGSLAELTTGRRHARHAEDWVRVTVTDRSRPELMFDRVKARFPHVLQVLHIPEGSEPAGQLTLDVAPEISPRELGGDFVRHVTGLAADTAELDLFERAYREASLELGRG